MSTPFVHASDPHQAATQALKRLVSEFGVVAAHIEAHLRRLVQEVVREELRAATAQQQSSPTPKVLTVDEVAKTCRVGPGAVRGWIRSGSLPAKKVGRGYLIEPYALGHFVSTAKSIQVVPEPTSEVSRILARVQGRN